MSIHRVKFSTLDMERLASKIPPRELPDKVVDFSSLIVTKPWGEEYLMFKNHFVEIWHLHVKAGAATSTHCHPNKKTGLILLAGEARFTTLNGSFTLRPLDAIVIEAGVFHATEAVSEDGIELIEVETPPAKHDLIRLYDKYGRQDQPYEGRSQVRADRSIAARFSTTSFETQERSLPWCRLTIRKLTGETLNEEIRQHIASHELLVILGGLIYGQRNDDIWGVAEILRSADLLQTANFSKAFNLTLLGIHGLGALPAQQSVWRSLFSKIIP